MEQMPICVGVGKCEIKKDEEKGEILRKKEIIYIRGKIGRNDKNDDKFDFSENVSQINMEKIFMDLNEDDNRTIIREKIIINKIKKENKKLDIDDDLEDEKEKVNNNSISNLKENNNININNKDTSNNNNSEKNEEPKDIKINKVQNEIKNEIKNNNDSNNNEQKNKVKKENEKIDMDNKSLEEIYEYINKDNKVKNKKKNKKRNKANRLKKNNNKNDIYDSSINIPEDPLVVQFKNDLKEDFIFANTITKIKPFISENWIKTITSY